MTMAEGRREVKTIECCFCCCCLLTLTQLLLLWDSALFYAIKRNLMTLPGMHYTCS